MLWKDLVSSRKILKNSDVFRLRQNNHGASHSCQVITELGHDSGILSTWSPPFLPFSPTREYWYQKPSRLLLRKRKPLCCRNPAFAVSLQNLTACSQNFGQRPRSKNWRFELRGRSSGSRGALGARAPLAPKISSKSCSFQAILRKTPYFEQILGSGPPLWGQNSAGPHLTKILDPRLGRTK